MNGKPHMVEPSLKGVIFGLQATRFAHSLRRSLWAEHLGISDALYGNPCQFLDDCLGDPVCEKNYKGQWLRTANNNTKVCNKYFLEQPADHHKDLNTYRLCREVADHQVRSEHLTGGYIQEYNDKVKTLHGMGLVVQPRESAVEALSTFQGHLYEYPLGFLNNDLVKGNLKPSLTDAEGVIPAKTFT